MSTTQNIRQWSTTASSNNFSTVDGGWPENMLASTVNNAARKNLACLRSTFEDYPFFDFGDTPTQTSSTTFTVSGDLRTRYAINRRIRWSESATGNIAEYGIISDVSYSGMTLLTTVTVVPDGGGTIGATMAYVAIAMAPQLDSLPITTSVGGTTTYTCSVPGVTAYHSNLIFFIRMNATNTGTSTINVNSLGAKTIKKGGTTDVSSGDLVINTTYILSYDGTNFQVIGRSGATPGGSTTHVQYNSSGSLAGNSNFTYDGSGTIFLGTGIELGNASDTTLTRASAGNVNIEGNIVYRAGGTDVPVTDGGTGVSTMTAYAVVCGGTTNTSAFQAIASVGSSGQVLTSNGAGALPTFQASSGGTGVPFLMAISNFSV